MGFLSNLFKGVNYTNINGEELENLIKENKGLLILDVRRVEEYRSGHIPNAKNIPVQELSSKLGTLSSYKEEVIVVYCASGGRSANAADILSKNGFSKVYNLGSINNYKGKLV